MKRILIAAVFSCAVCCVSFSAADEVRIKDADFAGQFYPRDPAELSRMIEAYLDLSRPAPSPGEIFALIVPHAGYGFSGPTAAHAYKLIRGKPYRTVVVMGSGHQHGFRGIALFASGALRTPLGAVSVDADFAEKLLGKSDFIFERPGFFDKEHPLEVQVPFLQKSLADFRIVPVVMGECSYQQCMGFARLLVEAIGKRTDVLLVASTDMCHRHDFETVERVDRETVRTLQLMDPEQLYARLADGTAELCGGSPVVTAMIAAKSLGHGLIQVLDYTNSARVTASKEKGVWTVGYVSCAIDNPATQEGVTVMLNPTQKKRLLEIARASIETYLKTSKKLEVTETDEVLNSSMGAFVTLHEHGRLRGCIGNLVGSQPLYLTVRDMAIEAATGDPRFAPVREKEMADIHIEISALSPLKRVRSADEIELGTHGVIVRRGGYSGVYLPQVATETGWSKEEFLSSLCAHKAGLAADAWKDPRTELLVFTAEVFAETQ